MAIDTSGGSPQMDYAEHIRTYRAFVKGTIILLAGVAAILAGMAIFLL